MSHFVVDASSAHVDDFGGAFRHMVDRRGCTGLVRDRAHRRHSLATAILKKDAASGRRSVG